MAKLSYRIFTIEKDETLDSNIYYITRDNGSKFRDPDGIERTIDSIPAESFEEVTKYIDRVYFGG